MLIHEYDIFYIDFIMITLVSLESLLNYIIQFILCFYKFVFKQKLLTKMCKQIIKF